MSIYVHAISALPLLESHPFRHRCPDAADLHDAEASIGALQRLDSVTPVLGMLGSPVHLIVRQRSGARSGNWLVAHVWSAPLAPRSFIRITDGLCVSSPEFCFLQLAKRKSQIELVRLGYELCSTYRLDPASPRGFVQRNPLTSKTRLAEYLRAVPKCRASRAALDALQWVADGAASPRETITAMLCSLPVQLGGWGLAVPHLNYEVRTRKQMRRIDLCWPDRMFGIEYDSDQEHTGADAIGRDSQREKEIELEGFRLARLTNTELKQPSGRELLYQTLCKELKKRQRSDDTSLAFLRRRLVRMLLAPHPTML